MCCARPRHAPAGRPHSRAQRSLRQPSPATTGRQRASAHMRPAPGRATAHRPLRATVPRAAQGAGRRRATTWRCCDVLDGRAGAGRRQPGRVAHDAGRGGRAPRLGPGGRGRRGRVRQEPGRLASAGVRAGQLDGRKADALLAADLDKWCLQQFRRTERVQQVGKSVTASMRYVTRTRLGGSADTWTVADDRQRCVFK